MTTLAAGPAAGSTHVLARLERLHPKVIDLSLGRVLRLLTDLGTPHHQVPPVVHVAGTNGKGSVVAFLRAILESHGYRVHVFTSPHLVRFHERIVVAGEEIGERSLVGVLEECESVNAGRPITFFEITTAAAFLAFARTPADFTLLETGLGGRLDATNVVAAPALTVLTPIALDHQAFLGETLAEIASEKAGILKDRVPCVTAAQTGEATAVIQGRSAALGAPVSWAGADWRVMADPSGMVYTRAETTLRLPVPRLAGRFQLDNAGLAVAGADVLLGSRLSPAAVDRGVRDARWPGRLQLLADGRLRALLPADWELWLDGGHNPAAAEALAGELQGWRDRSTHLVVGMLRSKDAGGFLTRLGGAAARILAVPIPDAPASFAAEELAEVGATFGLRIDAMDDVADALARLASEEPEPARVLICGSLYLAGAVSRRNGTAVN